jgi:3-methylcrotonyl-CoA carboxylase alpha subunit
MLFKKILVANRGEIAVRIIRACRELGIPTVAVYSEADRTALHVRMADEAVFIGPAQANQSYLSIEKILQAAQECQVEAVHPGYGFLSENAAFARAAEQAGLTFIGPPAEAIAAMGDKAEARRRADQAGAPVVPGYQGEDDDASMQKAAEDLGFPLLVKAAAGGGGKGMRVVWKAEEMLDAVQAARREAGHAFGDSRLLLERYIPQAHHVEIQVLADRHGKTLHLFERECSVQRRHQKIIEETPSPLLDEEMRQRMGASAVAAAKAVGYINAGTVEFIVDPLTRSYYFLEMNTRLQVEHPVTELITGLDLVHWQIRIAAGEALPFDQEDLVRRGHAIECRLYAEDPAGGFLPATGPLLRLVLPKGPGVRVDSGFATGDEITLHYDPLVAKFITHGENREAALHRMQSALRELVVLGVTTNWQFLQDVLAHPDFRQGRAHTTWVEQTFSNWQPPACLFPPEVLVAAALTHFSQEHTPGAPRVEEPNKPDRFSPWGASSGFRAGDER